MTLKRLRKTMVLWDAGGIREGFCVSLDEDFNQHASSQTFVNDHFLPLKMLFPDIVDEPRLFVGIDHLQPPPRILVILILALFYFQRRDPKTSIALLAHQGCSRPQPKSGIRNIVVLLLSFHKKTILPTDPSCASIDSPTAHISLQRLQYLFQLRTCAINNDTAITAFPPTRHLFQHLFRQSFLTPSRPAVTSNECGKFLQCSRGKRQGVLLGEGAESEGPEGRWREDYGQYRCLLICRDIEGP